VIKGYFYDNGAKTEKDESPGCTEGSGLKEENFLSEKPGFEDIGLSTGINQTPEEKY
jgi:hypothetical protein